MATWKSENSMLTEVGEEILNKLKVGQGAITVTRIVAGSSRVSTSQLYRQTTVSGTVKQFILNGYHTNGKGSELSFSIINEDFTEPYTINQIGVFVTHPDYVGEQLYHISQCEEGDADVIPVYEYNPVTIGYSLYLVHANSNSILLTVSPEGMVKKSEFDEFKATTVETHTAINNSITAMGNTFNTFKSGIRQSKLITVNAGGNLIASGLAVVSGHPLSVTDAIAHRALSLSIGGKSTQSPAPTVSSPVYHSNSKVEYIRNSDGVNAAKFLTFPSPIELRSLGDYQDTIEWDGAKWWKVQRIQEIIMDGDTNKVYSSNGMSSAAYCRYALTTGSYKLIQDHIKSAPVETSHGNAVHPNDTADFYAFHYTSSNAICGHFLYSVFGISNAMSASEKGTAINNWLKARNAEGKPVKVRYVLKNPIVTEISLTDVLELHANRTDLSCTVTSGTPTPTMKLGYALNTTDETTMYILKSLARKSEVQVANTFAIAELT